MQNEQPDYQITERTQQADPSNVDYSKTKETRFYANHVAANATAFDIRLLLSDVDIDGINNRLIANTTAHLIMSPRLAVFLLRSLAQAITGYETKFGAISMPGAEGTAPQQTPATAEPAMDPNDRMELG